MVEGVGAGPNGIEFGEERWFEENLIRRVVGDGVDT